MRQFIFQALLLKHICLSQAVYQNDFLTVLQTVYDFNKKIVLKLKAVTSQFFT